MLSPNAGYAPGSPESMPGVIARRTSRSERFSDQLLVGLLVDPRAVIGWAGDASISASLAALLIPFANAAAGIRHVPRSALRARVFWRGGHFTHHAKRPAQANRRPDAAGMTSVRSLAAAWRSGMRYTLWGAYGVGRD
jgi:hypothetical protein